ncbi:tannase/feruloyl esterase family alpha/beta hydrolase [Microbacterium elymi]|uniref:Tannase/feruloyl esterase family alpha/beta hydrolase n=1 Tax=Microbacterium elymi TaxID=2909587 RepID=A0ABY5NM30_9MICO|nr:tannase/feruloyl esterase family alpha/beta hydrolase [Microbacterium elymi]UUT36116.1 tannase/feruloyl esterase family alpha/beta hydrolase [Microbacterium elymi]
MRTRLRSTALVAAAAATLLVGIGIGPAVSASTSPSGAHPGHSAHHDQRPVQAHPSGLEECAGLADFSYPNTTIDSVATVAAGVLSNGGEPIGAHCLVKGRMNERVSPVDGQTYAIGFEMRLPTAWSGRYLYQANGGIDGSVATAIGGVGGGESGLQMGMAVISSDAGHTGSQNPTFGLDPQARLDYGYQAVGTLTPMAKALVAAAYGRGPDVSYMTGGSNGGRHTMVGAARYADEYDGFLAVSPGFDLPQAAVAQLWGAQQWATVATEHDLNSAFTPAERQTVAQAILAACDRLDGLKDGMVQASQKCQRVFSVSRDVPTCDSERDGTCLTRAQKNVVATVFAGAKTSTGKKIYASFPYDPGLAQSGWAGWKFSSSISNRDPAAMGYVFTSPPDAPALDDFYDYALTVDIDRIAASIYQTSGIYTESAMQFMTPPQADETRHPARQRRQDDRHPRRGRRRLLAGRHSPVVRQPRQAVQGQGRTVRAVLRSARHGPCARRPGHRSVPGARGAHRLGRAR